jgi:transcriptional regulator with XRE-family HTH domain
MEQTHMHATFGSELKSWRGRRRLSQLELGLAANVSARHIAFLETGRSSPSRAMVLQLSEALDVPRDHRNTMLNAAGFAPAYRAREAGHEDMTFVRKAIAWTLERHAPYPAFSLDRHWRLQDVNKTARMLLGAVALQEGDSLLDALTSEGPLWQAIENREDVALHMAQRLRLESSYLGGDLTLKAAATKLSEMGNAATGAVPQGAVLATRYRMGGTVVSLFSTISHFGTAEDILLAEAKVELLFPADSVSEEFIRELSSS